MKFGYVRVSTKEQNTARQTAALESLALDEVFIDHASGKNTDRPELQRMIGKLRRGDSVTVKSVDRLGRNTKDLLDLLDQMLTQGVTVQFLEPSLTFDESPTSRFILTMLGAVGELERSFIRQRQSEGIAVAKDEGRFNGRPKDTELRDKVQALLAKKLSADEIAKLCGCGRATVFRIKKESMAAVVPA
ncbi:recombinase family protein [Pseudomonas savastanoi]|uniref:Site-specific DNA recombinase n=2 Tax=Pseudomonas syringae group TaxID=136849 RepID=A0A0N8RLN9_PSESG|nr:recombinase family protein [Pseudomonas savastanoi]EGH30560.1 putative site-specific DNA recombinase [Pseudomonas syringae pv. japonica str. M301072]EFW81309.1 putative site-specific DNA recombinase [Pseudomonas savastanoi pv. glycinea str. B076]KPC26224.1 putative site-specific DNA recombinase [Pseudomonas savastanoi pv. glycinea]KPC30695.1 putative site-specific DNA recombinase [Pseudomonas savastanoi pv. glycinea]KPC40426.1 putative site-specific DNA recombinase [Pseudomonas savastanoi p